MFWNTLYWFVLVLGSLIVVGMYATSLVPGKLRWLGVLIDEGFDGAGSEASALFGGFSRVVRLLNTFFFSPPEVAGST